MNHLSQSGISPELEHFFDHSAEFLCILNDAGYIEKCNPGFEKLLGYPLNERADHPLLDVVHPEDISSFKMEFERLTSGAKELNFTIRCLGKANRYVRLDWSAMLIPGSGKLCCRVRDITDTVPPGIPFNLQHPDLDQNIIERADEIVKNEKRFRSLIENSLDMKALAGYRGKMLYGSPSITKVLGYPIAEFLETNFSELIHPEERIRFLKSIVYLSQTPGKSLHTQHRIRHQNGSWIWCEGNINNLLQEPGIEALVSNFRDVTERKRLEMLLDKANVLARIGGWEVDLIHKRVFWSTITSEIHETEKGYQPDLESGILFFKEGKQRERIRKRVEAAILTGESWDEELQIRTARDNERWVRTIGEAEMVDGKCVRIYGSFQDITERKKAEENLNRERTLLRTLIDNLPDYIYVKDTQSRHLINNKANLDFLGAKTEKETIGRTIHDFVENLNSSSYLKDDQLVFESGISIINQEESIVSPQGDKKYLLTTKVPLLNEDQSIIGLVGISRDITRQKQIELDLREKKYFLEKAQQVGQIGYWISDIGQNAKLIWSDETCRIFGISPDQFDGQIETFFNLIHPDDLSRLKAVSDRAIEHRLPYRIEHRIIQPDGSIRWVFEQGELTKNENGKAVIIGIVQDITERKKGEEQLIASEERFRAIIEQYPSPVLRYAPDGTFISANPAWDTMWGSDRSDLLASNILTDRQMINAGLSGYIQQAFQGEVSSTGVFQYDPLGPDESRRKRWVHMLLYPLKDSEGKILEIILIILDMTENRVAAQKLIESEKLYRNLFANMLHGFAYCKAIYHQGAMVDFTYLAVNSEYEKNTGLTNLAGKNISEILPDLLLSDRKLAESLARVSTFGISEKMEIYIEAMKKWFSISLYSPEKGYFVSLIDNITDRKSAESALLRAETNYRELFEKASDAIYVHEIATGKIIEINQRAVEMTGFSKEEILNSSMDSFVTDHPDYSVDQAFRFLNQAASGEPQVFDWLGKKKDGSHHWMEVNLKKASIAGEERILAFFREINDRKKAEFQVQKLNEELEQKVIDRTAQLKSSNEELEAFTYSVSHDLRAPLRAVDGYAQMLQEDYSTSLDTEGIRLLNTVQHNAKKMGALIDDLLAFSKLGKKEVTKTMLDMTDLVQLVCRDLNELTPHHAEIKINPLHPVHADYSLMNQVMLNLLSNAVKYSASKDQPVIEVSSHKKTKEIVYSVQDNGVGFEMLYVKKLFGVFQRLHSAEEFEGTGVGLAIVKRIIEKQGGKVWAKSKLGEGAVFYFSLPESNPEFRV